MGPPSRLRRILDTGRRPVKAFSAAGRPGRPGLSADADRRRWYLLAVVSLGQFMVLLDTTVVALALPPIQRDLHADTSQIEWVVSAYVLCFGGLMLLGGRLADRWGRRPTLVTGVLVFTASSLACATAHDPGFLIAARAVQGAGAAMLTPAALSMVTNSFTVVRERNIALGVYAALSGLGGTLGVVLGGLVTDLLSWRWIFYLNLPFGVLVLVGLFLYGRKEAAQPSSGRPDVIGALLVTSGLTLLVWATINITDDGWQSRAVLVPFAVAALLLAAFIAFESRVSDPLVPLRLFANPALLTATTGRLLTAGVQATVLFLGSFYMQRSLQYSTLRAGICFLPVGVVAILITLVLPRMMRRFGARAVYSVGAAGSLAAIAWWAWGPQSGGYFGYILPALCVLGVSMQACTVPVNIVGVSEIPLEQHGVASAALNAAFQVGTSLGVAVVASPALNRVTHDALQGIAVPQAWADGLRLGFVMAAVIAALNLINAFLLRGRGDDVDTAAPEAVGRTETRTLQEVR
jgi:EmrB/QacA subfamily drug resistance transporter